jgi:hypothetical protein
MESRVAILSPAAGLVLEVSETAFGDFPKDF